MLDERYRSCGAVDEELHLTGEAVEEHQPLQKRLLLRPPLRLIAGLFRKRVFRDDE